MGRVPNATISRQYIYLRPVAAVPVVSTFPIHVTIRDTLVPFYPRFGLIA